MFWETDPDVRVGDWAATAEAEPAAAQPVEDLTPATFEESPAGEELTEAPEDRFHDERIRSPEPVGAHHDLPLPQWALEPEWAATEAPAASRKMGPRLALGACAAGAAVLFAFATLALTGHGSGVTHHPAVAAARHPHAVGRPVVLASFQVGSSATSAPTRRRPRPVHVRRLRHAVTRPRAHRKARPAPSRTSRPSARAAVPKTQAPFVPSPAPQQPRVTQSAPVSPPPVAGPATAPQRAPVPATHHSHRSEFGFER
jgi:hypothetical protein